jgi:DHA1 family bicyclomycin/chloramphenicol resistance-like MFS transporter
MEPGTILRVAIVVACAQFLFGSLVSPLTGIAGEHFAVPMAVIMAVCSTLAVGAGLSVNRWTR